MNLPNYRSLGFTLVEVMIVVALIGMLAVMGIPNFMKARSTSQRNACISNLRLLDSATQVWALEAGKVGTDSVTPEAITPYLGRGADGEYPKCPSGGDYTVTTVDAKPTCSLELLLGHVLPPDL